MFDIKKNVIAVLIDGTNHTLFKQDGTIACYQLNHDGLESLIGNDMPVVDITHADPSHAQHYHSIPLPTADDYKSAHKSLGSISDWAKAWKEYGAETRNI